MAVSTNRLKSRLAARNYAHDPADATVATKIAWVPMSELFCIIATVISGAFVNVKIFAATDSSGTSPTEVKAASAPTTADAAGDQRVVEVSAEEVLAALPGATHVSAEIDMNGSDDIAAVCYLRDGLRFQTADTIADITA